ncbi:MULTISPECIES: sugar phosphate isomerase/epimerase [unclassified Streptomyces]|uniref:sugar phosphate isomerase/epimerase family protein n=1 Tax=unclassified Streptomyces TaxID=2593676 RepID=UPI000F9AE8D2|nr:MULTISPECIES: sugar phosphate isomerase/epimerase [unclassified Streptomyces]WSG48872.1 sugar phosphate isomerase/epimerase [Streptomyces sp. NBC_01732]WSW99522.1 sugar phosphate isomerase/epimerase [Streptomyces sp. NBC_00987]MCX4399020.1 sugar phosphate isomerase/epimerase [Streptomyces sp. NBC_01767]MCX5157994.1 sugar phosphate isomerase/epimerase [Streptomyces sp. NBC_00305]MCX5216517.1 sugar phosphate isomerase/epimerase [Streptomyces sp. NBC_00264]
MTVALPLGANPWIWHSPVTYETLGDVLPKLSAWGFDCVEIPLENERDWAPGSVAKLLDASGLAPAAVIAVMPPDRNLVRTDPGTVRVTQDYLFRCVDAARALGAPTVAGPMYAAVGRTWRMDRAERAAAYEELRENLAPVVAHARAAGVRLAVEPLNRYETSLLNTVDQTLEALTGLPESTIGLALDVYHQNIEERSLPDAVHRAAGRIVHVQVCANDRGTPGADSLDWPGFLAALTTCGYWGPLCIESFTAHNDAIAVAASVWRPLAGTQDSIAADGLAFLRHALGTTP